MKPGSKYLNELSPTTRLYTVKVKVIEKQRPLQYPGKNRFQRLTLMDDQGNTMRACIYSDDIDNYANIMMKNNEYEISNAFINSSIQMTINSRTDIRQLETSSANSQTEGANWVINTIPRDPNSDQEYDIIVVALHIGPMKTVSTSSGYMTEVCELFVTDNSLIVSAWNDLAVNECQQLRNNISHSPIIGLTCLKPSNYKGFSLATTRSTFITVDPEDQTSANLREWKSEHGEVIELRRVAVEGAAAVVISREITKIKDVLPKTQMQRFYDNVASKLCATPICIDVAATMPRMPQMKVIKWTLKDVIDG